MNHETCVFCTGSTRTGVVTHVKHESIIMSRNCGSAYRCLTPASAVPGAKLEATSISPHLLYGVRTIYSSFFLLQRRASHTKMFRSSLTRLAEASQPPFLTNPYKAQKEWPPDFTKLHTKYQFHLERKYRRRAKLRYARPRWTKAVKIAASGSSLCKRSPDDINLSHCSLLE